MVIEASKINDCGIYCIDCPRKNLTAEETTMFANDQKYRLDISVHCEHKDFCQFLIERIHTTDFVQGIFDNRKTGIDHLQGGPAGSGNSPTEKASCYDCEHFLVPFGMGPCADCGLEDKNFKRRDE